MKNQIKNIFLLITVLVITIHISYGSFNIDSIIMMSTPIISKKFNLKGPLNKDRLYQNLYDFLRRTKEDFIKIIVKITITDHSSRKRIVSLTKFICLNTKAKYDIQSFINYTLSKYNKYIDHYHPISINGLFVDYLPIDETNYLENSITNPWSLKKIDANTFPFPLTMDYESLADKINKNNPLYIQYEDCKGFKDAKLSSFRVSILFENEQTKICTVYLIINKEVYSFSDMINKDTGLITRKFPEGTVITNEGFEIVEISNENKITPIKPNPEGIINSFQAIALDCETYLDGESIQHLMSVAFFDGKISKFYFICDYNSELELVENVLNDILLYNNYNIYIHNGSRFDLIFLLNRIVELKDKLGLQFDVIYKDGEFLNINLSNGKNTISIKDSCKILLTSLSNLAKVFDISEEKGKFPFDFAKPQNFNYIGNTPDIKYFAFNGKPIITQNEYNYLVKTNWNFQEELAKYNINDCVILYEVMEKFYNLIQDKFNLDMKNNPTLSSLAFSVYRKEYIPTSLLTTEKINKGGKVYEILSSNIDSLNPKFDSYIRTGYFGGHVDTYIPHFDNSLVQFEGQVLYQYDVVSLYPYVMKTFDMPYRIKSYIKGNLLLNNRDLFESTLGFYKVKVISPISIINPILPYRTNNGLVLYPLGTWTGVYFSEEIKNAMKFGYKFEILEGYLFDSTNLFSEYIDNLFEIKLTTPKSSPMYTISKLLMNSLYGKFGIHQELPNYQILSKEQLVNKNYIDEISLSNNYKLVSLDKDITNPQSNVAIASAITAYARVHMSQFFNDPNHPVFYTDTDSAFTTNPFPENLVGKDLGQLALESKYNKFITLGPKFYGGITVDGQEIVKVKGLAKESLPSFNELEILLENGKTLTTKNQKSFKDLGLGTITLKNLDYLIKPTENKRDFVYFGNKIMYTKSKVIKESD